MLVLAATAAVAVAAVVLWVSAVLAAVLAAAAAVLAASTRSLTRFIQKLTSGLRFVRRRWYTRQNGEKGDERKIRGKRKGKEKKRK